MVLSRGMWYSIVGWLVQWLFFGLRMADLIQASGIWGALQSSSFGKGSRTCNLLNTASMGAQVSMLSLRMPDPQREAHGSPQFQAGTRAGGVGKT